jgi:hypothetical protein
MLLANLNVNEGLVNGTRGIVTGFAKNEEVREYLQQHKDDQAMQNWKSPFPRVQFELKNTIREVSILLLYSLIAGFDYSPHLDYSAESRKYGIENSNTLNAILGADIS